MVKYLLILFFGLLTSSFLRAQNLNLNNDPFAGKVRWRSTVEPADFRTGDTLTVIFTAQIEKGFHVYSVIPPKKSANLPTVFELKGESKGCKIDGKLSEEGKMIKEYDDVFETEVMYFKEKVVFKQKIKLTDGSGFKFSGLLKYQVCNEEGMCTSQTFPAEFSGTTK